MRLLTTPESKLELSRALRQMHTALEILDTTDAPRDIASHLDLAICRLEHALGMDAHAPTNVQALILQLENQLATSPGEAEVRATLRELQPI